jgi:hypothetical protein
MQQAYRDPPHHNRASCPEQAGGSDLTGVARCGRRGVAGEVWPARCGRAQSAAARYDSPATRARM